MKEKMTIISSKRQDAIEPFKPVFRFWFVDQPQFACTDRRGRIASLLKSYRANKDDISISRLGLHDYEIKSRKSSVIARIKGA